MNLTCVLKDHQSPALTGEVLIGDESTCARCGETMVLTCARGSTLGPDEAGEVVLEGRWIVRWRPRRYVPVGTEDERKAAP